MFSTKVALTTIARSPTLQFNFCMVSLAVWLYAGAASGLNHPCQRNGANGQSVVISAPGMAM